MAEFIVVATMSGTRNGEPWPRPGELIEIGSQDEAARYLNAGYIKLQPPEEARAAMVAPPAVAPVANPAVVDPAVVVTTPPAGGESAVAPVANPAEVQAASATSDKGSKK